MRGKMDILIGKKFEELKKKSLTPQIYNK